LDEQRSVLVVEDDQVTPAFLLDNLIARGGASVLGRGCGRSR
jgi:hypothetical protein